MEFDDEWEDPMPPPRNVTPIRHDGVRIVRVALAQFALASFAPVLDVPIAMLGRLMEMEDDQDEKLQLDDMRAQLVDAKAFFERMTD